MLPETRYAKSGDVHIAYQIIGKGPFDLVFVPGFISHVDHVWDEPRWAGFLERLASFSRLICFDKRGTGLSDRVSAIPTLEERMDDVRAVMDAVGSERAALFGISEGGPMSLLFAATYPERALATLLFTDIVGSTERAASLGDREWRHLLETHHACVRRELVRFRGKEIKTLGDGFLATFDGPARGVRCAEAIRDSVRGLGLEVRSGLHTGEIEILPNDVGGIAVHVAARVAQLAGPGEVLGLERANRFGRRLRNLL